MRSWTDPIRATTPRSKARAYFALQALLGALWWVGVYASDDVRRWTLGAWPADLLVAPDLALFAGASAIAAGLGRRGWALVAVVWTTGLTVALGGYALTTGEAGWGAVLMAMATLGTVAATATLWFGRLPMQWFFVGPFAFRVSGQRSPAGHLGRSLGQLVGFWALFFGLAPMLLSRLEDRLGLASSALHYSGHKAIGAVVFVVASGFGLWACVSMALRGEGTPLPAATARRLVVVGPYRHVRNPMALAGAVQTVGAGLWLGSWLVLWSAVLGGVIWDVAIRPSEERDLLARFGPDYRAYRSGVRRWVPRVSGRSRVPARIVSTSSSSGPT